MIKASPFTSIRKKSRRIKELYKDCAKKPLDSMLNYKYFGFDSVLSEWN